MEGFGTKLKIGANSIAKLTSINGLSMTADTRDVTTHDSEDGYREFEQGLKDGGEVSASGFFDPADTNGQNALKDAFDAGTVLDLQILFPPKLAADWSFKGIVTAIGTGDANLEDGVPFETTIKVTGKPTLGLTASTGLSELVLDGGTGVLAPSFATGTYLYTFSGVSGGSFTVTATAASHTLKMYVDGAHVADLTSAVESAAITLASGSKKVTILATEPHKVTKMYEIVASV